jgi:hypothetical protein
MATSTATIGELRAYYRRMQEAGRFVFGRAWDEAVRAKLRVHPNVATPRDWVDAAEAATLPCERCHATGIYTWGGTVNGRPVHSGTCHHCGGSGMQDLDDMFRNRAYVLHSIRSAV